MGIETLPPLSPQANANNTSVSQGAPTIQGGVTWVEGVVLSSNPLAQRYTVRTDTGATFTEIPRIVSSPGLVDILPELTRVLVFKGGERGPYIVGVIAAPANETNQILPHLDGAATLEEGDSTLHAAGRECFVGALSGGTAVVYSTPMAHLMCHPEGDVDLYSGTFKHISAFGYSEISVKESSVNYSLRGGASITGSTAPDLDDAWTLRIDAGSEAEMLDVRVTDTGGRTLCRHYMSSTGMIEQVAVTGRLSEISGSDVRFIYGTEFKQVEGTSHHHVSELYTENYAEHQQTVVGPQTISVGGVYTHTVASNSNSVCTGDAAVAVLGQARAEYSGNVETVIGANALPTGQTAQWINKAGGHYHFVCGLGAFNILASTPNAVNLGVDGTAIVDPLTGRHIVSVTPALYHAALYQPLEKALKQLLALFDTHTHGTGMGPSSPPIPSLDRPALEALIPLIQSQRVKIGL